MISWLRTLLHRWHKRRLQRWTRFQEPRKGQFIDTTRPFSDTYMRSLDQRSRRG